MTAKICRRAHAVEQQGILFVAVRFDIETMTGGIDALVECPPPVELIEERTKPVRVLVVNGYRTAQLGHVILAFSQKSKGRSLERPRNLLLNPINQELQHIPCRSLIHI